MCVFLTVVNALELAPRQLSPLTSICNGNSLPTTDGRLHIKQMSSAELDPTSGEYKAVLTCGTFNWASQITDVVWTVRNIFWLF